jgi:peptidoglycan/xylan/chitin deacetylase (PgdA/CDA1 family)
VRAALHAGVLRRLAERRAGAAGVVLVYHRIGAATALDAAVDEAVFHRQLRHLVDAYRVVPPRDIVEAAGERRAGQRYPVAITFDDDVESHARVAAPALRAAGAPATFFLTGRTLDGPAPFWWDDLERTHTPPPSLKEAAARIEALAPDERAAAVAELRRLAPPGGDRGLSSADVHDLARDFEIGFHPREHDPLATVPAESLPAVVREGRDALAEAAGTELASFAYPHGRADERAAAAVRAAGYERAFTGAAAPVGSDTDRFLIPRYQAATTDDGLLLQLARAIGGGRS